MRQILVVALLLALSACGVAKANKNSNALLLLNSGDTKERVVELMGVPAKREVYGNNEYWLYKTDVSSTEMGTFTPILITNGRVVGWGRNYYDTATKTKIEAEIKYR